MRTQIGRRALMCALVALSLAIGYTQAGQASSSSSNSKTTKSTSQQITRRSEKLLSSKSAASTSGQAAAANLQHHQQQHSDKQLTAALEERQHQADKKQDKSALLDPSASGASFDINGEEYVQIKPEEMTADMVAASAAAANKASSLESGSLAMTDMPVSASGNKLPGELKQLGSSDDEQHLSSASGSDSINALESGAVAAPRAYPAPSRHYGGLAASMAPHHPQRPAPYGSGARGPRSPGPHGGQVLNAPRGYLSMTRGKLAGSLYQPAMATHAGPLYPNQRPHHKQNGHPSGQQYQHQQAAHPGPYSSMQQSSRYLPRGAAAGYAAFREFVRAQAHKYKQNSGSGEPGGAYGPAAPSLPMPQAPVVPSAVPMANKYNNEMPYQLAQTSEYQMDGGSGGSYASSPKANRPDGSYQAQPQKAKVTIAQAYIPHLNSQPAYPKASENLYGGQQQQSVLNKLYGGHAPQGNGRPEYNKDFGMVIHYPQATVYTEPMTVEQVHKLAGSSITQILEQLQHNLATGQTPHIRDESNTIRANQKHHLGHGLTLHAKEYYAPGKGGHYVSTTAAVISHAPAGGSKYAEPSSMNTEYNSAQQQQYEQKPAAYMPPADLAEGPLHGPPAIPELGSGYERVKAAVSQSATKYAPMPAQSYDNSAPRHPTSGADYGQQAGAYQQLQQHQQQQQKPTGGYAEPLGTIASLIGGELESLYNKANSVLSKQIDPEIHAHIQSHLKSFAGIKGPLKMSEHDHKNPLTLTASGGYNQGNNNKYNAPAGHGQAARYPAGHARAPRGRNNGPYQQRPSHQPRRPMQVGNKYAQPGQQNRYQQSQQHHHNQQPRPAASGNQYNNHKGQSGNRPAYSRPQQQQEAAAVHQQMMQMLQDFKQADEQYGTKNQPAQSGISQGYPDKLIQHKRQQNQYQQQAYNNNMYQNSNNPYEHMEGLEIPQGPNDQIGEISELLEALKGTLEQHSKPEQAAGDSQSYGSSPSTAGKDQSKMEDVKYIASALGQVPSYAIQVPVGQSGGQAPQGADYAQQQQPQQQPAVPAAPQLPYSQPPAPQLSDYQQISPQQVAIAEQNYGSQQSYSQASQQQVAQGYTNSEQSSGSQYGAQPSYGQAQQQHQQQSYASPQVTGNQAAAPSYQQQQQNAESHQQQQPYSSNEHTSVINHLVPVQAAPAVATVSSYSSSAQQQQPQTNYQQQQSSYEQPQQQSSHQQPINQITIGAPDANAYQSAQSLSSFVESLGEYQEELLRQPVASSSSSASSQQNNHYQSGQLESASSELQNDILKESSSSSSSNNKQRASSTSSSSASQSQSANPSSAASNSSSSSSSKRSSAQAGSSNSSAQEKK